MFCISYLSHIVPLYPAAPELAIFWLAEQQSAVALPDFCGQALLLLSLLLTSVLGFFLALD